MGVIQLKIVHICITGPFTENMAYQENELVYQHAVMGHQVLVISSVERYNENKEITNIDPGETILLNGAKLVRIPYKKIGPKFFYAKVRAYVGINELLENFAPDIIVFHGLCAWSLFEVTKFVKMNPSVLFYADSHEDFNNSARNFCSKWFLHYLFYRIIFKICLPVINKVFCVSKETEYFVNNFYGCSRSKLEFFPLGGIPIDFQEHNKIRKTTREMMGWSDQQRIFIQSGKFNRAKRLEESLNSFIKIKGPHLSFVIVGYLMPDVITRISNLLKIDNRIQYIGWKTPEELKNLLCAADVYVQPGSQSATLQMALCCRKPIIVDDVISHHEFFHKNGWLVNGSFELFNALNEAATCCEKDLYRMAEESSILACDLLDYRKQAVRLLSKH